jgi:predicted secreted protein
MILEEENLSFRHNYKITVKKGQRFVLTLESNRTTGYEWFAIFDTSVISVISQKYVPSSLSPTVMGSSGKDIFAFKSLAKGTTTLKMLYKREWEKKPLKVRKYLINII